MSKLIFFVDDDKMILNLLEYTINNKENIDVMTFQSGEECLNRMDLKPDIIVLDHFFKVNGDVEMNGLEILKLIREKDKNIPVIILTGQEDEAIASSYMKSGATEYVPKNDYFVDNVLDVITKYTS
jgi:DNA-binding NtrC family response regulator